MNLDQNFVNYKSILDFYADYISNSINDCKIENNIGYKIGIIINNNNKNIPWNEEELNALKNGVTQFGLGKWKKIKNIYSTIFSINNRKSNDLYNKWNSLEKKNIKNEKNSKLITNYFMKQ